MRVLMLSLLLGAWLLAPMPLLAQEAGEALPPPEMGDAPAAPAVGPAAADPSLLPPKVTSPAGAVPEVTIRTDAGTGDVIEEYRQNGVVYMVRVRPERGPEYLLLDTNGDGRLDTKDGEGPVRPVYWTLYEWQ